MAIIQNPKLSDLLLLVGFLALPLSLGELVTPAMADFLGKYTTIYTWPIYAIAQCAKIQKRVKFIEAALSICLKG